MNFVRWLLGYAILAFQTGRVDAAITITTTHAAGAHDLDVMMSSTDALQGLIALQLAGDNGWHQANPASADPLDPNGLPAFTDGVGAIGGVIGLLNDFPTVGLPTKLLQYDFAAPTTIQTINIFTGNVNNADGRIFSTTVIRYSTDGGAIFTDLGYFQSDPSGSINSEAVTGAPQDHVTQVSIFDDAGGRRRPPAGIYRRCGHSRQRPHRAAQRQSASTRLASQTRPVRTGLAHRD
jgi:hypothetical protein